ncbi:MAG: hypothetical protein IPP82_02635 [Xanthomonadales bacterium]|nr:hypothetical protein [Xanthomonadales bacterium]
MIGAPFTRIVVLFVLLAAGLAHAAQTQPSVRELLDRPGLVQLPDDPDELFDVAAVRRFYSQRGFQPAWMARAAGPRCNH